MPAISDAQNAANLATADNFVAINLGLDLTPSSEWTQTERVNYAQGVAAQIKQYPAQFNDETVRLAGIVSGANTADLLTVSDTSFDWDTFTDSLDQTADDQGNAVLGMLNNLGSAVSDVVQGVTNAASATQWALPVGVVLIVFLLAQNTEKRVSGTKFLR